MNIIEKNLLRLTNIEKNTKSMLGSYTEQQINSLQQIINCCYLHAIKNNVVLNSKLLQVFRKLNAKFYLNVENGQIIFNKIPLISNIDYYSKLYSDYLDKIISYLQKNNIDVNEWSDLFQLINSTVLDEFSSTSSIFVQKNEINIAEQVDVLVQKSALHNIILSDLNRIDFSDDEQPNLEKIRAKLSTGNKHQQIKESDVEVLVDVQDVKTILFNNEQDNLNNKDQSSALN